MRCSTQSPTIGLAPHVRLARFGRASEMTAAKLKITRGSNQMIYTNRRVFALIIGLLVTVFATGNLLGQATATGTIQGTVTDKSQALVVGAQVVVTFKATGVTRTGVTNDTGSYRFDFMPAGNYEVKVTKDGFRTVIQAAELLVGQSSTVNVALEPGAATQVAE